MRALRIAVVLNGQRSDESLPHIKVKADKEHWQLSLPKGWTTENKLLAADMRTEQEYWHKAGWMLEVNELSDS